MRRQSIAPKVWRRGICRGVAGILFYWGLSDQSGATAIEYALVAMGISIVIVAAVNGIGANLNGTFNQVSASIK